MTAKQIDILIAGGGIAGLTLAALLGRAGFSVVAADPAPLPSGPPKPTGRTVALMQSSANIVKATGLWPRIENDVTPMRVMRIIDRSIAGQPPVTSEFAAHEIDLDCFGYNIPNGILHAALLETVQAEKNIRFLPEHSISDYQAGSRHARARLDHGKTFNAALIIGADGRNSAVRKCAGIQITEHDYAQSAITCFVRHRKPHHNSSTEFHRPAGPLAFVPLPGDESSVVWVEPTDKADAIMRLARHDFIAALEQASHHSLGALELTAGPSAWPLKTLKAKALTAPRMALIAEAAHVMSPITAQGLNLSLRDIAALVETLVDARRCGEDIGSESVLGRYAARRKLDIETRVHGVDGMNRIVSTDMLPLKSLRRTGLKAISSLPPLRETAMRLALAPEIDQGRLARGLPL